MYTMRIIKVDDTIVSNLNYNERQKVEMRRSFECCVLWRTFLLRNEELRQSHMNRVR